MRKLYLTFLVLWAASLGWYHLNTPRQIVELTVNEPLLQERLAESEIDLEAVLAEEARKTVAATVNPQNPVILTGSVEVYEVLPGAPNQEGSWWFTSSPSVVAVKNVRLDPGRNGQAHICVRPAPLELDIPRICWLVEVKLPG